jgi:hypothetical protein
MYSSDSELSAFKKGGNVWNTGDPWSSPRKNKYFMDAPSEISEEQRRSFYTNSHIEKDTNQRSEPTPKDSIDSSVKVYKEKERSISNDKSNKSKEKSDRVSKDKSDSASKDKSKSISKDKPERISKEKSEKIWKDKSDRASKDKSGGVWKDKSEKSKSWPLNDSKQSSGYIDSIQSDEKGPKVFDYNNRHPSPENENDSNPSQFSKLLKERLIGYDELKQSNMLQMDKEELVKNLENSIHMI